MWKYIFITVALTLSAFTGRAQKLKTYTTNEFQYKVFYTTIGGSCSVDSIVIMRFKGNQPLPKIIPPKNKSYCGVKYEPLTIDDYNFDKHDDIGIVQYIPASATAPYYYWLYNINAGGFVRNDSLEKIPLPKVDKRNEAILSEWKSSEYLFGINIYTWEDGILTKTQEIEKEYISDEDGIPIYIEATTRKLVKGKFKVVSKRKEKIDEGF